MKKRKTMWRTSDMATVLARLKSIESPYEKLHLKNLTDVETSSSLIRWNSLECELKYYAAFYSAYQLCNGGI